MSTSLIRFAAAAALVTFSGSAAAAQGVPPNGAASPSDSAPDPIATMVGRLTLDRYKATVKGLTQFGDRRQGTDRNRAAVDWIEAQLKSYGCTNTERATYTYPSAAASDPDAPARGAGPGRRGDRRGGAPAAVTPGLESTRPR